MYAVNPKQPKETYRIWIAHTEQDIDTIIWMGVFSGNKTGFVRPGHIYIYVCMYIYVLVKAPPQVCMKNTAQGGHVERQIQHKAKPSAVCLVLYLSRDTLQVLYFSYT